MSATTTALFDTTPSPSVALLGFAAAAHAAGDDAAAQRWAELAHRIARPASVEIAPVQLELARPLRKVRRHPRRRRYRLWFAAQGEIVALRYLGARCWRSVPLAPATR